MNKETIKALYKYVCDKEKIKPLPIVFIKVGRGGACLTYNQHFEPLQIQIDLKRCEDIEHAIYHETAHQILLLKSKDPAQRHNKRFMAIQNKLLNKYMYIQETINILKGIN